MNIIVLICDGIFGQKPVYIDHKFKLYDKNLYYVCNPSDLYAIDLAMKIKKELESVNITAISIGNARAANLVKKSLLIGVDRGIWGDCENVILENSYDVGYVLAKIIEQYCHEFDILLLGNSSQDFGFGLVGSTLAHKFGSNIFDNISFIENINVQKYRETRTITFHKKMEKGDRLICESHTPVIISVAGSGNGINGTCLQDIIKNNQKGIEVVKVEGILNSNNGQGSRKKKDIIFDGYHEPRPRPKKIPVPDSSLSAMDRLKNITTGNMPKKATNMFEGEPECVATEFVKYIIRS
jgi:electron transfer flavoprotein beta subunit